MTNILNAGGVNQAHTIGLINGYIVAAILSIIIIILCTFWYLSSNQEVHPMDPTKPIQKQRNPWIFAVMAGMLIITWLFVPWLLGFLATRKYSPIVSLESGGISHADAVKRVQDLQNLRESMY